MDSEYAERRAAYLEASRRASSARDRWDGYLQTTPIDGEPPPVPAGIREVVDDLDAAERKARVAFFALLNPGHCHYGPTGDHG